MNDFVQKYDRAVPRYTSYPTAPHFHEGVNAETYRSWLAASDPSDPVSLYIHIPFCRSLCWFCGCHTKIVRRDDPVANYVAVLQQEVGLVADALHRRHRVSHVHWGGGTPTILSERDFLALTEQLGQCFDGFREAEIAVEMDPRTLTRELVQMLRKGGVTRASLGVQDFDPEVQEAINRIQPYEMTARAVAWLREVGIEDINFDLMYGLPRQSIEGLIDTVDKAAGLEPQRLALFGYAHVPWMKRHQRLIDETELHDAAERFHEFQAASERLVEHGYVRIGLDHFALPNDSMAKALTEGRLRRNFQGYTTDQASILLGFGASAIGSLAQGYVQNITPIRGYSEVVSKGELPVARGCEVDADDILRRDIIERLMCDMRIDLGEICKRHGQTSARFTAELQKLAELERDGLIRRTDGRIEVTELGRPLVRAVSAVFDRYLSLGAARHSTAV